jgi:cysteine-rich repeat protein
MVIVDCGNGTLDAGEACDDGDTDSMDDCTTSCTVNDRHIGAPCTCTGYACDRLVPWEGTVVGCTNVASHADSTRTLACLRSARETTAGVEIYFAEGYCSLVAVGCVSMISGACDAIPQTGDVSSFTCPTGYEEMTEARSAAGGLITVTTKSCHVICSSDADCRWKAEEETGSPWYGSCGEYRCVPRGDTGAHICVDEQNFPP